MPKISEYANGNPPVDTDQLVGARAGANVSWLWSNLKSTLKTYFDTLYGGGDKYPMEARLTLETGVPVSQTNQTAKTTLYLTKYNGDQVAVYDGSSAWSVIALTTDLSITLALLTAALPYDVFVYSNSGTLTLELTAWTNTNTRATALTTQNGVLVKTGATTRRYLGTICIAATGQCEDSDSKRFLWNYYNQIKRKAETANTTASWAYTGAVASREYNNGTGQVRGEFVVGVLPAPVTLIARTYFIATGTPTVFGGVALNSTTGFQTIFATAGGITLQRVHPLYSGVANLGYNYITQTEYASAGNVTYYGPGYGGTVEFLA